MESSRYCEYPIMIIKQKRLSVAEKPFVNVIGSIIQVSRLADGPGYMVHTLLQAYFQVPVQNYPVP
jgi:hypothetical protein